MKDFQIFRYLKKWMPVIVLFFVIMTVLSYFFLSSQQEYVATTVIRYNNPDAVDGLAPDGTEIDVTEISSSDIMTKVMRNLGLGADEYSVEELCSSIVATPILQEEEEAIQLALNEKGERFTEQPTEYIVTCTMGSDVDEDFVRNLLNEVMDVYFSEYSGEHINNSQISNDVKGFKTENYDYLEAIEKIGSELEDTIGALNDYIQDDYYYRSAQTGYSFNDIQKQFILLQDVNLYRIYSLILGNKITRDPELLEARYLDRIASYALDGGEADEQIADSNRIIETYLQKLRDSGNTNIDFNYILDEVHNERENTSGSTSADGSSYSSSSKNKFADVDRTVEYETLLQNWCDAQDDLDYSLVDRAYCEYILKIYRGEEIAPPAQTAPEDPTDPVNPTEQADPADTAETGILSESADPADPEANLAAPGDAAAAGVPGGMPEGAPADGVPADGTDGSTGLPDAAGEGTAAEQQPGEGGVPEGTEPGTVGQPAGEENVEVDHQVDLSQIGQNVVSRTATAEEVEQEINTLLARMNELYEIADETSEEYNEYLGAQNIQTLSSVSASPTLNLSMYVAIIAVVFLLVGCCGAILAGRIGDILEYVFLRDHQTGCMNRVSCDNYIQRLSQTVLPSSFCCFNLQLQNQSELNATLGREGTDNILAQIGRILIEMFGSENNSFIGYNGSGQFWAFFEMGTDDRIGQELERLIAVMQERFGEYPVTYTLSGVNAGESEDYHIRSLISKSAVQKKKYTMHQAGAAVGESVTA